MRKGNGVEWNMGSISRKWATMPRTRLSKCQKEKDSFVECRVCHEGFARIGRLALRVGTGSNEGHIGWLRSEKG